MTYHAFRQRGAYGNRIPGLIDPKGLGVFNPLDVSHLSAWFDFSDPSTLYIDAGITNVSSDGDKIAYVEDKSGGSPAQNTVDASKPLYKTAVKNMRSIARLDGIDDNLILSRLYPANTSIIIVTTITLGTQDYILASSGSASAPALISQYNSLAFEWYNGPERHTILSSGSGFYLITITHEDNGNLSIYLNGSRVVNQSVTVNIAGRYLQRIGSSATADYAGVDVADLAIWDKIITDTERTKLESYFNDKWDIY